MPQITKQDRKSHHKNLLKGQKLKDHTLSHMETYMTRSLVLSSVLDKRNTIRQRKNLKFKVSNGNWEFLYQNISQLLKFCERVSE